MRGRQRQRQTDQKRTPLQSLELSITEPQRHFLENSDSDLKAKTLFFNSLTVNRIHGLIKILITIQTRYILFQRSAHHTKNEETK